MSTPADSRGGLIAPAASRDQILLLDQTLKNARREIAEAAAAGNEILRALTLAMATQQLRELLTPSMMVDVLQLMNTPLGFRTDRDPSGDKQAHAYPVQTVRDVVIVAMIDGARLVGNEFNIIAGNYYRTLEQFERRIREYPGLTEFRLQIGVPTVQGDGALADMRATWKLSGKPGQLACCKTAETDTRIPIRVNKGMGLDAIIGKARRKFLARLLDHLDGTSFEIQDAAIEGQVLSVSTTLDQPAGYAVLPATDPEPAAAAAQQEPAAAATGAGSSVADAILQNAEGTLLTLEMVTDCQRLGANILDRITAAVHDRQLSAGQGDSLRQVIAGLVDSRIKDIRAHRGK